MTMNINTLNLNLGERSYGITVGRNILSTAGEVMNLNRKVFIVTDSGVPCEYSKAIASQCAEYQIFAVDQGEKSKSFAILEQGLQKMLSFGMTRYDCCVAVGGGVVGDLTGFMASIYMRGIDFYNVPTTLLACVDSSIGGKTAINFEGIKNIIGSFHQPRHVLVDTDTLKTLDRRLISEGLAESVKMALTSDAELFEIFEKESLTDDTIDTIVLRSLNIKKSVVEQDEKEGGLRKILNFGHTLGHGIEASKEHYGHLLHGECVALGMIPMCSKEVKARLISVLGKLDLPTDIGDITEALKPIIHDKKINGNQIEAIYVDAPGSFEIRKLTLEQFKEQVLGN